MDHVGSHTDPPFPPDAETAVLAVEPVLLTAAAIPKHANVYVITAAISDTPSFQMFNVFNAGVSSSLSEPTDPKMYWAQEGERSNAKTLVAQKMSPDTVYPPFVIVPVLTLEHLLAAIPEDISVEWVKTDMQGFDLRAARSASAASLRRVKKYQAELYWCGL